MTETEVQVRYVLHSTVMYFILKKYDYFYFDNELVVFTLPKPISDLSFFILVIDFSISIRIYVVNQQYSKFEKFAKKFTESLNIDNFFINWVSVQINLS